MESICDLIEYYQNEINKRKYFKGMLHVIKMYESHIERLKNLKYYQEELK